MTDDLRLHPCRVLALGPHPDDVEIACAGTLLAWIEQGHAVSIVDLTRGEKGSHGTGADRDRESAAAAKKLGLLERCNLGLPDCGLDVDGAIVDLLVRVLRTARPRLLLAPLARDVHPDHTAAARATERAFFLAGLRNHAPHLGEPWRPRLFLRYPGNQPIEPTIAIDISKKIRAKAEVIRCYGSQLSPSSREHLVQGLDLLERAEVRDRFFGARIGVRAAEPFWHDGPLPLSATAGLLGD